MDENERQIQIRFIDYIHSMYEHIRHAYGNPPVIVNLHVPLREAVMQGVPPADIGEEWFNIVLYLYIKNIRWSSRPDMDKEYPSPEKLEQSVIDDWYS